MLHISTRKLAKAVVVLAALGSNACTSSAPEGRPGKAGVVWMRSKPAGVAFARTETTVAQFRQCVKAGKCSPDTFLDTDDGGKGSKYCNWLASDRDDHPMNCVTWEGAEAFCDWVGGRLPTAAEADAEASNDGSRDWPWGDSPEIDCDHAIWGDGSKRNGCGRDSTWPVCSKPDGNSISGLCDMSGNVEEWTADTLLDRCCVVHGGSWRYDDPDLLRATSRDLGSADIWSFTIGFRCVEEDTN